MPERINNLENVKVGDEFMVCRRHEQFWTLVRCVRLTPQRAEIGDRMFRKSDGVEVGTWGCEPEILYVVDTKLISITNARPILEKLSEQVDKFKGRAQESDLLELTAAIEKLEAKLEEENARNN